MPLEALKRVPGACDTPGKIAGITRRSSQVPLRCLIVRMLSPIGWQFPSFGCPPFPLEEAPHRRYREHGCSHA